MKFIFCMLTMGLLSTPVVYAQTSADVSDDLDTQTSLGLANLDQIVSDRARSWRFTAGAGIASVPRYEGAAGNRVRVFPLLDASNGHFFIGTGRGIGYNFSDDRSFQYGLRLHRAHGRKQDDDPHLNGTGDIGKAAEAGIYANAHFSNLYFASGLSNSSHGAHLQLGGGYTILLAATDLVRFGPSLNWANKKYMQTYFGIDATQSAASLLPVYTAGSGIKDYAINVRWLHFYSGTWFSNAGYSFKRLAGGVRQSPLVQDSTLHSASLAFGYRF